MPSTYSGDPAASDKDWVRFKIGDTQAPFQFTDEEILAVLAEEGGNRARAAASMLRTWAIHMASLANFAIGRFREDYSKTAELMNAKADELLRQAITVGAFVGGTSQADKTSREQNTDNVPPNFKRGMMENPDADAQTWEDE